MKKRLKKSLKKPKALDYTKLRFKTSVSQLRFETTDEIKASREFVGQTRAIDAASFGIGIQSEGFNLFAMGPTEVAKRLVMTKFLEKAAKKQPVPNDWCYVFNFSNPQRPFALELPAGKGDELRKDMEHLVEALVTYIPIIFESEEYRLKMDQIHDELSKRQDAKFKVLQEEAKKENLSVVPSQQGFVVLPVDEKGEVISLENFSKLPEEERKDKEELIKAFTKKVLDFLREIPEILKEKRKKEKQVRKEFTLREVGFRIQALNEKYKAFPKVIKYFKAVKQDVVSNVKDFMKQDEHEKQSIFLNIQDNKSFLRYKVNVIVDNSKTKGAPVIYEEYPSYSNLICRVEHMAQFGAFLTDFTLIKPGSLHEANGGYLIIDAIKVLQQPFAWEGLKRALYANQIKIETPERMVGILSTVSLDPVPIPLNVKVILLGDRLVYYLLLKHERDFAELFKVVVDFEETLPRNKDNLKIYVEMIATLARKNKLLPFNRKAVAHVIDHSLRLSEDTEKMSAELRTISDLLKESSFYAEKAKRDVVKSEDVAMAILKQIKRQDRVREHLYESVAREILMIETKAEKIGQINGLSVLQLGGFSFGLPTRITARTRLGKGEVIDIEREAKLSGNLHSKGVLILSGFISGKYLVDEPLSLQASLTFEQTYGMVDGDSASMAELCVLLSSLADVPIKQSLAITGSVNQFGDMQAIGGVNEKIEGFYDICKNKGFAKHQGVIIPSANVTHLMLRQDVVEAVKKKKFHIYPVSDVNEAITLLTGVEAGARNKQYKFPKNSINGKVEECLERYAKLHKKIVAKRLRRSLRRK